MMFFQTLRTNWKFFYLITVPILLLPIIFCINISAEDLSKNTAWDPTKDPKIGEYIYVLLLMAFYWVVEAAPLAIVGLLPVFLYPVLSIMSGKDISSEYMNDTMMLFLGGLMFAIAVEKTDLHTRIAVSVFNFVGTSPWILMLTFQVITWFLSMWISNTASTAMIMPIVDAILVQIENSENE